MHGGEGDVHRAQDVARFEGAAGAGAAGARTDALRVQGVEDRFAFDVVEGQVQGVRGARGAAAVDFGVGDQAQEVGFEGVAARCQGGEVGGVRLRELAGAGEAGDVGDVFGAAATAALLVAAVEVGAQGGAAADVEDADALGGVHLVAGEGEEVDVPEVAGEVDGELAGGLGGVGVEDDGRVGRLRDARPVADRPGDAGFVVGHHEGDEEGVGTEGADVVGGGDAALAVDGQAGDFAAAAFEFAADFEDGRVLDGAGHDVAAGRVGRGDAEEGGVVALGGAGGEEDFGGIGRADEGGHRGAGVAHGVGGAQGGLVHGAGVEVAGAEPREHGFDDFGGDGGGGVVVGVDEGGGHGGSGVGGGWVRRG